MGWVKESEWATVPSMFWRNLFKAHYVLCGAPWNQEVHLEQLHGTEIGGHLGKTKTVRKVRVRFRNNVAFCCQNCVSCAQQATDRNNRAHFHSTHVSRPLQEESLDITWIRPLPKSIQVNSFILTVVDNLTRWIKAHVLPDQTTYMVASY